MRSSTVATTDPLGASTDDGVLTTLTLVAPVGLGLFPLGIGFGVLVVHAGLPWWWAPLSTGLIYAGSLEFLLIPMALPAPRCWPWPRPQRWSMAATSSTPCRSRCIKCAGGWPAPMPPSG